MFLDFGWRWVAKSMVSETVDAEWLLYCASICFLALWPPLACKAPWSQGFCPLLYPQHLGHCLACGRHTMKIYEMTSDVEENFTRTVSRVTNFSTPMPLGVKKKKGICLSFSWKLPESSVNSSLSIWQKDCVLRRLFKAQACLCNWGVWPGFPWVT